MAVGNVGFAARPQVRPKSAFSKFLSQYFYFSMTLLMAAFSAWGFSHTVDVRLLHANPPRPLLLWLHAMVFSAWVALFIAQSALVRVRKIKVHRTLGWFGAALATTMVGTSFPVSLTMMRFERTVNGKDVSSFLSILWCDMIVFGALMALAIYFRKRPEYHRRLVFMASCQLMQAAFVRFAYIGTHGLFFPALDLLIVSGIVRDLIVEGRVNKAYLYGLPSMVVLQTGATYLQQVNPAWWQATTRSILGW
ncbi:MAG TPA: hypothetical protein VKT81_20170 [Bryobacteraceae bacterium]|nr:hypothetical protein [Bryobacteraceae bacterium]